MNSEQMQNTAELIAALMNSRTITHIQHLQAKGKGSYATHMALAAYYEAIPDLVDALAESIQGSQEQIIVGYPKNQNIGFAEEASGLIYMQSLKDYFVDQRMLLPLDSEIQNELDNIATLINSTIYKLAFLE